MRHFRNLCDLQADDQVLDIGCGVGRIAIPLTQFLSMQGSYDGFDIVPDAIRWCQKEVTDRYPNFRFEVANIYNKNYHPTGKIKGSEYQFNFPNTTFDLAIATSLFTHLLPADLVNYVSEAARVLKKDGRCLFTFYLWNSEAQELAEAGKAKVAFPFEFDVYRSKDAKWREEGIAYHEGYVRDVLSSAGFEIEGEIQYGAWSGRKEYLSHQDIIVLRKR
ncbi:UNVERIFIED_CONTAM: hypothetical protein GTU68_042769 [Idotea baltica]|nr:hypothetical protein [Idotea baltica]